MYAIRSYYACEPGCRVLEAVATGEVSSRRLGNYIKLINELDYTRKRQNKSAARVEKERLEPSGDRVVDRIGDHQERSVAAIGG